MKFCLIDRSSTCTCIIFEDAEILKIDQDFNGHCKHLELHIIFVRLNSNDCPKRGQIITVTLHHLYLHTYVAILMANSQNDAQSLNCLKPLTQGINELANFHFLQRLSVIFGFHRDCLRSLASCRDYCPRKLGSYRDCLCDSASCRDSTVLAGSKRSRTASAEAKYH